MGKLRNKVLKIYVIGSDMRQAPHHVVILFLQTWLISDEFEKNNIIMKRLKVYKRVVYLKYH